MSSGVVTTFLRSELLRAYFDSTWTRRYSGVDFALTRAVAAADSRPDQLDEPVPVDGFDVGYSRVPYGLVDSDWWAPGVGSMIYNRYALVTPEVTGDWGTLYGWALVTAGNLTGGLTAQLLAVGRLTQPYRPQIGDELQMDIGSLVLDLQAT